MSALLRKGLYFVSLSIAIALIFNRILPVLAQQATGSIKFKDFYPPTIIISPTLPNNPSLNPTLTPAPTNKPDQPEQKFSHFSQLDPRWINYNPKTSKIGGCGCGETSVAMVLAYYFDTSSDPSEGDYNPRKIWDYYDKTLAGRCGSGSLAVHTVRLQQFGLKATAHVYTQSKILTNYLNSGYMIILHYKRPWNDRGHYVVLAKIQGSDILVYDPLGLADSSQPQHIENGVNIVDFIAIKK